MRTVIKNLFMIVSLLVIVFTVGFCNNWFARERGYLEMENDVAIYSKPFPPDHPTERELGKNNVLKILHSGERIYYHDTHIDKDFKIYLVEVDGKEGYIIYGSDFHHVKHDK